MLYSMSSLYFNSVVLEANENSAIEAGGGGSPSGHHYGDG